MKRRIAAASVAAIALTFGGVTASALAGEDEERTLATGLSFEQVAEGPVCNPVHTEGGIVTQGESNLPAISGSSYICGQQASLPPTPMPGEAMPGPALSTPPAMAAATRHDLPDVTFAFGSAWLSDRAIAQVDYFTYYDVTTTPVHSIHITGYADETGSARSNLLLSRRRAEAVAAFMETKGVPRSRMIISGAGSVAGGDPAANRRVEVMAE